MDVFFCADDRQEYLDLLSQSASQPALACCLMSNHADFVVVPGEERPLARTFGETHRRYTRMVNFREGVAGAFPFIFDGRTEGQYKYMAYLFFVAPAFRIIAEHFAASASDSNPKTAEYFFPTTWAIRKSRLIPASAMACAVA